MLIKTKGVIVQLDHLDYGDHQRLRTPGHEVNFSGRAWLPYGGVDLMGEVDVYVDLDVSEAWRTRAEKAEKRADAAERIIAELKAAISKVTCAPPSNSETKP